MNSDGILESNEDSEKENIGIEGPRFTGGSNVDRNWSALLANGSIDV